MAGDDWFISLFIHSRKEQAFQTDVFLKSFSLSTWGKLYGSLTWHLTPSVRFRSRQQNAILGLQLMAIILHKCSFFLWRPACFTCTWFRKIQPQAHGSFYVTNTHTHSSSSLYMSKNVTFFPFTYVLMVLLLCSDKSHFQHYRWLLYPSLPPHLPLFWRADNSHYF